MIKTTYKPGKDIFASDNNSNYTQIYLSGKIRHKLRYKGYWGNNNNFLRYQEIGYQESYWGNKSIKYIL
jgi:hypothetical protein